MKFVDTAGIREGQDLVENLGIERSYQAMADADLTLVVVDISGSLERDDRDLIERASQQGRHIVVGNKWDLILPDEVLPDEALPDVAQSARGLASHPYWQGIALPTVSALTGEGIAELRRAIVEAIAPRGRLEQDGGFITSLRHEQLLKESREALEQARSATLPASRMRCCCWIFTPRCGPSTRLPEPPPPTTF